MSHGLRGRALPLIRACSFALLACVGATAAAGPLPLVNTGHRGTINDLAYDAQRRMLFSAGEDGTIRVWSHDRRAIVRHLRLGAVRVLRIALHPDRTLLAAVARSTAGHDLLEVWDWRTERRLYRRRLEESPLHLGFTSLGSSLVYSRAQFDSVVFLEPATGRRQERLSAAFGIVSYVAMSTNERTIMTYQPTGEVRYWDAATSALTAVVPTLPGLESIALSADKNLLVARSGGDLVAIDVVTGAVRSRLRIPRQAQVVVADQFAQVSVLQPDDREDGVFVLHQRALDRALTPQLERRLPLAAAPTAAAYARRTLFFAEGGTIREVLPGGVVPFVRDELVVAEALAADGATLLVATRSRIAVARLQRSEATPEPHPAPLSIGAMPRLATANLLRNPFGTAVGLTVVPAAASSAPLPASTPSPETGRRHRQSGAILVWNREGESGRLGTLDPRTGRYRLRISGLPAPLSQVSLAEGRLVLLDGLGNIALYRVADVMNATVRTAPEPEREFWAPGTGTVLSIGDHLIAGRTRAHATTTPLLKIDATHAETLLVPDDALLIFDLAQHAKGQLLTLGVEPPRDGVGSGSGRTRTVLRMRDGSDLARQRLVYGISGEDLSATLAEAPDRQRIYFTLGADAVRVWDGTRLQEMERTDRQPRQLLMVGDLLVARNADATFTVWNRFTRGVLFHLYLFHDFNWIVARPNGDYVHSPGAEQYLADSSRR